MFGKNQQKTNKKTTKKQQQKNKKTKTTTAVLFDNMTILIAQRNTKNSFSQNIPSFCLQAPSGRAFRVKKERKKKKKKKRSRPI